MFFVLIRFFHDIDISLCYRKLSRFEQNIPVYPFKRKLAIDDLTLTLLSKREGTYNRIMDRTREEARCNN